MDEHSKPASEAGSSTEGARESNGRTARDDLVDGLGLVFRAARRAAETLDASKLDELGQKAKEQFGTLDKQKLSELGRQAVQGLDPARIERFAGEASRELAQVVDRLATRVERFVDEVQAKASGRSNQSPDSEEQTRLRVRDEEKD